MEIFNHIDNFLELYDEKKKKNKTRNNKTDNQGNGTNTKPGVIVKKTE
jgi:hypothetical protein